MKRACLLPLLLTAACQSEPAERKPVASVELSEQKGDCRAIRFEDSKFIDAEQRAENNLQLVEKLATLIRAMDREIATPDEARRILNVKPKPSRELPGPGGLFGVGGVIGGISALVAIGAVAACAAVLVG